MRKVVIVLAMVLALSGHVAAGINWGGLVYALQEYEEQKRYEDELKLKQEALELEKQKLEIEKQDADSAPLTVRNGYFWMMLPMQEKLAYVAGFIDAKEFGFLPSLYVECLDYIYSQENNRILLMKDALLVANEVLIEVQK